MVFNRPFFIIILAVLTGCAPLAAPRTNDPAAFNNPGSQLTAPHTDPAAASVPAARTAAAPITSLVLTPAVSLTSPSVNVPALILSGGDSNLAPVDVWQRIRNGFSMREIKNPLVERHQQWYASRPDYIARMTERAQRYLYFIVEEVEKRGMPTEIALLPMIESAFNPGAYSGARASGIWQFIPSTGKNFGMQQNWWYDGRRDITSATTGALDYLQQLHNMFGDWELALAAYNWGENAVQRAQAHNRKRGLPVDYASLKLPNETRNYLPKLLAVKNLISDPASFGLALRPIPNQPYFAPVVMARHIDVKLAAKMADISIEEFIALNPAHNRPVILQQNADVLLLPVDKVAVFRTNLEQYSDSLVSWQAYRVKKGERLDKLASRFGLSVEKLCAVNGLSVHAKVRPGQELLVPLNGENADSAFKAFNIHLAPSDQLARNTVSYTVRKGDTLSNIARRYHVSLVNLRSWNKNTKILRPGQRIYVVQTSKPQRLAKTGKSKKRLARKVQRIAYNR